MGLGAGFSRTHMPSKSRGLDSIGMISESQQKDHGQLQLAHQKTPSEGMFTKILADKSISQSHSFSSLQFPDGAPHLQFGEASEYVALGVKKKVQKLAKICRNSNLHITQYLKRLLQLIFGGEKLAITQGTGLLGLFSLRWLVIRFNGG